MNEAFKGWVEKYQILQENYWSPPHEEIPTGILYTGFMGSVGPGWVPIIEKLAEDLIKLGWDRQVFQIKEKFGTLRFYVTSATEEMYKLIGDAEDKTAVTCEECGAPGKLRGEESKRYWVLTLCDECNKTKRLRALSSNG